jgi:acyl carrier protein
MAASKERIRAFVAPFFENYNLAEDEDMFAVGMVNSLFAMQLVLFVEKEFQITVENEDLDFENFRSINSISSLVDRKLNGRQAP